MSEMGRIETHKDSARVAEISRRLGIFKSKLRRCRRSNLVQRNYFLSEDIRVIGGRQEAGLVLFQRHGDPEVVRRLQPDKPQIPLRSDKPRST